MAVTELRTRPTLARYGWIGIGMVAVFWALNWLLPGVRTHLLFAPLWVGYALTVDALVLLRTGTSILTRSRRDFILLFFVSAPAWWIFEFLNDHTRNWEYLGHELFTSLEFNVYSTISFATVLPAVFGSAELLRSFRWMDGFATGPKLRPTRLMLWSCLLGGVSMLFLMLSYPRQAYPLMWLSVFFILEPICYWLGKPCLFDRAQHGDWRTITALWFGSLLCGLFWEMWNFYAFPKWIYHTPGVEFAKLFEMPLLGYLGYIPFGMELYVLTHLLLPYRPALKI